MKIKRPEKFFGLLIRGTVSELREFDGSDHRSLENNKR